MKPTEKQLKFIKDIEKNVKEKFKGNTIKEASQYISRNIQEYKRIESEKSSYDRIHEDWITEERTKFIPCNEVHSECPLCGGKPKMLLTTVYNGRADYKWSCERYYYKNIVCPKCHFQTEKTLFKEEYDDSDTIYPKEYNISDSDIWKIWDNLPRNIIYY